MRCKSQAGQSPGTNRVGLPSESDYRRIVTGPATDSDYRYGPATDTGRVRDDGHSSTVYIPATCVCSNRGTSIVTTVDDVGK